MKNLFIGKESKKVAVSNLTDNSAESHSERYSDSRWIFQCLLPRADTFEYGKAIQLRSQSSDLFGRSYRSVYSDAVFIFVQKHFPSLGRSLFWGKILPFRVFGCCVYICTETFPIAWEIPFLGKDLTVPCIRMLCLYLYRNISHRLGDPACQV
jgi:hypothetical protein